MPLKVLVLHGFTQNKHLFQKNISAIQTACSSCEFVFVDAPHRMPPNDFNELGVSTEALDSGAIVSSQDPKLLPRAWWRVNKALTKFVGWEESVLYLRDVLAKNHFDGIFGFSQGAAMAGLICALLERPHLYPQFLINGNSPHPPLKFGVFVAGFMPRPQPIQKIFSEPFRTPTLHVIGSRDIVVIPKRSQVLYNAYINPRVEIHTGGHYVPSKPHWAEFFADFIGNFAHPIGERVYVPSPVLPATPLQTISKL